jgi:hypothetical protein
MKLLRRQFLHLSAGAVALPAFSRIATAQTHIGIVQMVGYAADTDTTMYGEIG